MAKTKSSRKKKSSGGGKSRFAATIRKNPSKFPAKTVAWAKKH
jgi:hypothetical protein